MAVHTGLSGLEQNRDGRAMLQRFPLSLHPSASHTLGTSPHKCGEACGRPMRCHCERSAAIQTASVGYHTPIPISSHPR